jgi:hypothetical protein
LFLRLQQDGLALSAVTVTVGVGRNNFNGAFVN